MMEEKKMFFQRFFVTRLSPRQSFKNKNMSFTITPCQVALPKKNEPWAERHFNRRGVSEAVPGHTAANKSSTTPRALVSWSAEPQGPDGSSSAASAPAAGLRSVTWSWSSERRREHWPENSEEKKREGNRTTQPGTHTEIRATQEVRSLHSLLTGEERKHKKVKKTQKRERKNVWKREQQRKRYKREGNSKSDRV